MENCEQIFTGKFLKSIRLVFEITQEKMAAELNMSSSMLRNIEQGKAPLSPRSGAKIVKRLPAIISKALGESK